MRIATVAIKDDFRTISRRQEGSMCHTDRHEHLDFMSVRNRVTRDSVCCLCAEGGREHRVFLPLVNND